MQHSVANDAMPKVAATVMSYPDHMRAVLKLGLPLMGGHVAQFAIGLTDAVMLGRYGVEELAAVTLAGSFFFVWFILGSGFAFAVMPVVATALGRGEDRQIRRATRMGLWLSLAYAALAMPVLLSAAPILRALGQGDAVAAQAGIYLQIAGWGLVPGLLVMVMKSYLGGLERAQAVLWITVLAALVNAGANYLLIFGNWGFPELGMTGAALASLVTQIVSLLAVMVFALRALPEHELLRNFFRPDWEMMGRIFRLGLPIGFTTLSEVTLFSASALMMGWLGTETLAAHGIAIQIAGLVFMLHLGLSNAATIRVGNALGRGDADHLRRGAQVVICVSLLVAVVAASSFWLMPEALVSLFLDPQEAQREEILTIGAGLMAMAALFQFMDAMQAIALGLLRGILDTTVPMIIAACSYWAIGVFGSYVFGFVMGLGGVGVWLGLVLGLTSAGGCLMWRFWRRQPQWLAVKG